VAGIELDKLSPPAGKQPLQTEVSPELLGGEPLWTCSSADVNELLHLEGDEVPIMTDVVITDRAVTLPPAHEWDRRRCITIKNCSHEAVTVMCTGKDWVLI
jgi:hypothetical protein